MKARCCFVIKTDNGKFYQLGEIGYYDYLTQFTDNLSSYRRKAIKAAIDLNCTVIIVSLTNFNPIIWENKLDKDVVKHFSFNPKTNKTNHYESR
jgi:hypothetical protein